MEDWGMKLAEHTPGDPFAPKRSADIYIYIHIYIYIYIYIYQFFSIGLGGPAHITKLCPTHVKKEMYDKQLILFD